jgi:hypothetical protein
MREILQGFIGKHASLIEEVWCLLPAVCSLLSAISCLLCSVCCLLPAVCFLLPAFCCLLCSLCDRLSPACFMLSAVYSPCLQLFQLFQPPT